MEKAFTSIIIVLFLCLQAGTVFSEDMAKEGSVSGKTYLTGTYKILSMGKEMTQMNYEGYGVNVSDEGGGLTNLSSVHVLGGMLISKGEKLIETGNALYGALMLIIGTLAFGISSVGFYVSLSGLLL